MRSTEKGRSALRRDPVQRPRAKAQWPAENSQDEKRRTSTLRKSLLLQYAPMTEVQRIAFELVLHCWRRCYFLMRREAGLIRPLSKPETGDGTTSASTPEMSSLCGPNRQALRRAIKLLSLCKESIEANGRISEELTEELRKRLGEDFVALLTQWTPPNREAALLAHHLVEHRRTFGGSLPHFGKGECQAVLDPTQCQQMQGKLLEVTARHLEDVVYIFDVKAGAMANGLNSRPTVAGSFREAMQDLQRSVAWFRWLKRIGL